MMQFQSDNEIMCNFINCIKAMYPYLILGDSYCYDSWDRIIEPLYFELVLNTYHWKYHDKGAEKEKCHVYETEIIDLEKSHIICTATDETISVYSICGETLEMNSKEYEFIFNSIGDGKHILTGSFEKEEALTIKFDMVKVQIKNIRTGKIEDSKFEYLYLNEVRFKSSENKKTVI